MRRKRVAVLISGRGSNMAALIAAAKNPVYPADISLVLSNVDGAAGLDLAREAGVTTELVPHGSFGKDREAFDHKIHATLERHRIDIVCLAGFMRLLTPWLVKQWEGRMLNIHPALLPSFRGLDTHARALQAGVRIHGATVHFVAPEVDSGPIVIQGAVAVRENDTPDSLAARIIQVEHRIYPLALKLVAEGRVEVIDGARCRITGAGGGELPLVSPDPV
jgi:phosphoribosylglycinamide formyltransferase 1